MTRKSSARLNVLGENRILAGLPASEFTRLTRSMEHVTFHQRQQLYVPDKKIDYVYFPLSGVLSVVVELQTSGPVEVGTVGNEGMLGIPILHGADTSRFRAFAQVTGTGLRMKASLFAKEVNGNGRGRLRLRVARYGQAWLNLVGQSTACNARHNIEQRMCRWLLMSRDRVGADEFPITQDFLGQMLGVRRPSVTVVAGLLQRAGLISYHRGVVTIKDPEAMEQASCECYETVRQDYIDLLC